MTRRKVLGYVFIVVSILLLFVCLNVNFKDIYSLDNQSVIFYDDVNSVNKNKNFGNFVDIELNEKFVSSVEGGKKVSKVIFKLFGIIPIREVEVQTIPHDSVYVGGIPLGFSLKSDGLIVLGNNTVITENGFVDTLKGSGIQVGDIITEIDGNKVSNIEDIEKVLNSKDNMQDNVKVRVLRGNDKKEIVFKPALDINSKKYKLGIWVKDDASGVGTLTFVNKQDRFGALGHPIAENEHGTIIPSQSGSVYNCNVVGLNKGEKGIPGELKGIFLQGKNSKGVIDKNCEYGVFGQVNSSDIIDKNKEVQVGGRLSVKPGKALVVSSISGVKEEYEIEIIKVNYQPKSSNKSFIFRVTDKRLLNLTGGVVQGMSGSPILQNGKLVGAITHVFVSDPTKGYGIYIDWMLNE